MTSPDRKEVSGDPVVEALKAMQKAFTQLLPGIGNIACKDYANINEAPILAARAIAIAEKQAKVIDYCRRIAQDGHEPYLAAELAALDALLGRG
jgi:hypothetical protein